MSSQSSRIVNWRATAERLRGKEWAYDVEKNEVIVKEEEEPVRQDEPPEDNNDNYDNDYDEEPQQPELYPCTAALCDQEGCYTVECGCQEWCGEEEVTHPTYYGLQTYRLGDEGCWVKAGLAERHGWLAENGGDHISKYFVPAPPNADLIGRLEPELVEYDDPEMPSAEEFVKGMK